MLYTRQAVCIVSVIIVRPAVCTRSAVHTATWRLIKTRMGVGHMKIPGRPIPIGNNGAMHFSAYLEPYNHAHSLHVYFWHNLGTMYSNAYPELYKDAHWLLVYFTHCLGQWLLSPREPGLNPLSSHLIVSLSLPSPLLSSAPKIQLGCLGSAVN